MKAYFFLVYLVGLTSCMPSNRDLDNVKGSWQIIQAEYGEVYAIDEKKVNASIGQKIIITSDCITFPEELAEQCCFATYRVDSIKKDVVEMSFECAKGNYEERIFLLGNKRMEYRIDGVRFVSKKL